MNDMSSTIRKMICHVHFIKANLCLLLVGFPVVRILVLPRVQHVLQTVIRMNCVATAGEHKKFLRDINYYECSRKNSLVYSCQTVCVCVRVCVCLCIASCRLCVMRDCTDWMRPDYLFRPHCITECLVLLPGRCSYNRMSCSFTW